MKNQNSRLRKIIKGLGVSLVVLLAMGVVLFSKEIQSISSIREIMPRDDNHKDGNVYEMTVHGGYGFDKFIKQGGVKNDKELIKFVTGQLTKGLVNVKMKTPDVNCSSFSIKDESGNNLFARNYDMKKTNIAILHTNPGGGRFKSISSIDLSFLTIDKEKPISGLVDKIKMMVAPYAPLDGMNEKGLAVSIHMSYQGPDKKMIATDIDTEKPDYTSTSFLRYLLDYCQSVDEAIEFAKTIDLHESANSSFHYMVADSKGDSAVLSWVAEKDKTDINPKNRKLVVVIKGDKQAIGKDLPYQIMTNFILVEDYYEKNDKKYGEDRYLQLQKSIEKNNGMVKDYQHGLEFLSSVGRRGWKNDDKNSITTHSVVYDLTGKKVHWVGNEHFGDKKYYYEFSFVE